MIFILDKSMNIRDSLSNSGEISHITPFFDDIYTSYLETGAETYQFSTLANTKESQHLIVGNHIAFQYEDEYKLFTITEIEETHDENFIKTVYCEMAGLKLINKVIRPIEFKSTNLRKFLEEILSDTDWNIGLIDIGLNNVCDIEVKDYTNAYSLLQTHIRESYNGEIHFTVKFEGSKATKYINVYSNRGQFDGFRFSYDSNLTSITRTINFDDLATALIGVGNNGLTFKEIETEDKPLNQDFITDESAYLLWNDNGSHILGYEKFDTDSPQELLKLTREKLKERCQPKIKYELNPELLGETVKIGDTVYVIDNEFNPPIHLSARINQLSISLTDKSNNSCVLSNFTEITSNITEEMRQIASQLEGYVDGQFPIGGDKIQDGAIDGDKLANGQIIQGTHIFANSIQADHIQAETIDTEHLKADSIDAEKIQANSITSNHIQSNTIETEHLKANIIQSEHIQSNTIDANHIISNSINSGHIQTGSITAGSGIIADGAIGNAQISSIDAGKIEAGTIDTSKVTIQGSNGHLRLKGNRMQVFQGVGNQAKERVSVGDVNGDGTVYGLRVRGADGQTILLDENGVKSEGITDGSITNDKINEDANIDGAKLNINSVINRINTDGTEVIQGTKIEVDGTNLGVKLSEITNKQTSDGERITQAQAQITANQNAIKLKVDEQTYTTDKNAMTSKLEKNTSEISTMKGQIALKVEQTDIENAKNELTGMMDNKISSAKAELKVTTDGISQKVGKLETTTTTLSGKVDTANTNATDAKNTANTANNNANQALTQITTTNNKLASIESNVNGITSRVSNVENKQTTVDGKVSSLESRMSTAESKITETAITNTVKKNFYTKSETDSQITSKGYQTSSQVQQTVDALQMKFEQSGGYNLLKNSAFKNGTNGWSTLRWDTQAGGNNNIGVRNIGDDWTLTNRNSLDASVTNLPNTSVNKPLRAGFDSHKFKVRPNTAYTLNCLMAQHRTRSITIEMLCYDSADNRIGTSNNDVTISNVKSGGRDRNNWTKVKHTWTTPSNAVTCHLRAFMNEWTGEESTAFMWICEPLITEGNSNLPWTPNADEVYTGITTIDKEGITVNQSNISTYTTMDASSFRVENNTGGTVAEFSQNSQIPNLTAGIINANEIYSPSICTKSPMSGSIKYIVNGSTGNDNNNGTTYSTPFKTVAKAVSMLNTQQDRSVDIEIYGSVTGFDVKGINGAGAIRFYFSDDAIVNGAVIIGGITNTIGFHGGSSDKPTFKNGISIYRCRDVEISSLTFRGTNSNGNNIYLEDVTFARIISCDLGGLSTQLLCAIQPRRSNLWIYNCRGSKITDVVGLSEFSIAYAPRAGTSNVPDYSNAFLCDYDGAGRIHNWSGGNFVKTPSKGWNPAYTPTQRTSTWSFNKIWSDETLHGWSDRQELIQGYSSTWNTGRWTGYMQFTDGMDAIRSAISGGTNLSGRIYVQRTSSSGNSTGSKLCLYASDGTLITNSTSINRSQGVWVSLSSSIIQKIQSGAITYFYLKADSNNTATYFKCERNAKIEITYTK